MKEDQNRTEPTSSKSPVSFSPSNPKTRPEHSHSGVSFRSGRTISSSDPKDTNNDEGTQLNNDAPSNPPRQNIYNRGDSFRAIERKGSRGKAGGRCSRLSAYVRERTSCLFSRKDNDTLDDQYYIPPPEEENESIFDAFCQVYSGAFDDLSMWLYAASFWKILLFYWLLYMMFVVIFVVFLYFADRINLNDPTKSGGGCINTLREEGVLPLHAQLEFAFELSWTTFTTVGYGVSDCALVPC